MRASAKSVINPILELFHGGLNRGCSLLKCGHSIDNLRQARRRGRDGVEAFACLAFDGGEDYGFLTLCGPGSQVIPHDITHDLAGRRLGPGAFLDLAGDRLERLDVLGT
jgi:hypothetical protein